jgi:hypothetical protein
MPEHRLAVISDDGLYRYTLTREWGPGPAAVWIMLNPSTADANVDDPTIRRCRGFAQSWGCGKLVVVNLFALRTTKPGHLLHHPDPIGPANDYALKEMLQLDGAWHVVAWGAAVTELVEYGLPAQHERIAELAQGTPLWCLGTTRSGQPRHPLYVARTQERLRWSPVLGAR